MIIVDIDGQIIESVAQSAGFVRTDITSWNQIERVRSGFTFARACAVLAEVPNAASWRLSFDRLRVFPWRIIDTEEYDEGAFPLINCAFALQSTDSRAVRDELEAYGRAFRGMAELRSQGYSRDLMSDQAIRVAKS